MLDNLFFEFQITESCNLKCQMCDHFAPLSKDRALPLTVIKKDLATLSKVIGDKCININILGGEPLLHPEIIEILEYTRSNFIKSNIQLLTNGILLNQQLQSFWNVCQVNNIKIMVTKYPIQVNYDFIKRVAIKNSVFLNFLNTKPVKTSFHFPLDLSGNKDFIESHSKCKYPNYCITIKDCKLYMCPIRANIQTFITYFSKNLKLSKTDYLNINDIKKTADIETYLSSPINFCKYCDIENITYNHTWKRSDKSIFEWIISTSK